MSKFKFKPRIVDAVQITKEFMASKSSWPKWFQKKLDNYRYHINGSIRFANDREKKDGILFVCICNGDPTDAKLTEYIMMEDRDRLWVMTAVAFEEAMDAVPE